MEENGLEEQASPGDQLEAPASTTPAGEPRASQQEPPFPAPATPAGPAALGPEYVVFRRSHFMLALMPILFILGLAAGYVFWGFPDREETTARASEPAAPTAPQQGAANPPLAGDPTPVRFDVSADDDPALGPEDAPILMIEFSDFNCPFCRKFRQETFGPLMDSYGDKIRFVYRDLPVVGGGAVGFEAAQAANCAREQGAFWEFHDALFTGIYALEKDGYRQAAQDLGLDAGELIACLESGKYAQEVEADRRDAFSLGVTGTPTFFINGIPMVGAQPLSNFVSLIQAELDR